MANPLIAHLYSLFDEREFYMTLHKQDRPPRLNDPFDFWLQMIDRIVLAPVVSLLRLFWRMLRGAVNEARRHRLKSHHRNGTGKGNRP